MKTEYFLIQNAKARFVSVFAPNKHGKFSIQLILDEDDPQVAELQAKIDELVKVAFPGAVRGLKKPLHFGDLEQDLVKYPEYAHTVYFEPSSLYQPQVIGPDGSPLTQSNGHPWSGDIVNAAVNLYSFGVPGNKGIGAGLGQVQFWEAGQPSVHGINAVVFPTAEPKNVTPATSEIASSEEKTFEELLDECQL